MFTFHNTFKSSPQMSSLSHFLAQDFQIARHRSRAELEMAMT